MYRPPVVVVLGHVDHGKTTLLDTIRKTNVTAGEAGGITQGIGGYEVEVPLKGYHTNKLTFIDTPGHEAFSQMRARGAKVADIAILIVDATSGVQPQTIESISHIKESKIPFVIAANKVDLKTANLSKVMSDLAQHSVQAEGYGGQVPMMPISARNGDGVPELLEALLLVSSEHEFTYDPNADIESYIIEAKQEKGGIAVSAIIKNGTLKVGDTVFAGSEEAKVRALITDTGEHVKEVVPSMPFKALGFKNIPDIGALLTSSEAKDRVLAQADAHEDTFDTFFEEDNSKKLKIIVRADSQGSLDALLPNLKKNANLEIILSSIGEVAKSDIFLAKASKAIIIGFATKTSSAVESLAKQEKVVIKTYDIIYNLLEDLEEVSQLLKEKEEREKNLKGEAKIQAIFTINGSQIAGIKVTKGKIEVNDRIELLKGKVFKGESIVDSIKQRAENVKVVKKGEEGGLLLNPVLDIQQGDVIESYSI